MARRGRFRTFDPEHAARCAMRVFWEHGYEGATLAALKAAMGGICSPSLYAAFGSKEALFKRALELYWREEMLPAIGRIRSGSSREAIEGFLVDRVLGYTDPARPKGCLLGLGTTSLSASHRCVEECLRTLRLETTRQLQACLERVARDGEFATGRDPLRLARLLLAVLQGLSIQARDGVPRQALLEVAKDTAAMLAEMRGGDDGRTLDG